MAVIVAPLLWLAAGTPMAQTIDCATSPIKVDTGDPAIARGVCAVAEDTIAKLSACHLPLSKPVSIEVSCNPLPEGDECLGTFDPKRQLIRVLHPRIIKNAGSPESAFIDISAEILFNSVIVHELTHAAAAQAAPDDPLSFTAQEYMAYAMQVASLPDEARALFLKRNGRSAVTTFDMINPTILMFAPGIFAARAHDFYRQEGNGCDSFKRLLDGELDFVSHQF